MQKIILLIIASMIVITGYADNVTDPCSGPTSLLNIVNRPTAADSPCVIPFKKLLIQSGYQYQKLVHSGGSEQNLPNLGFRLGLPHENEFLILIPNYVHQSHIPMSGFTATTLGAKHQLGYNKQWVVAVEGLVTFPGGNAVFGNTGTETTINWIVNYTLNNTLNVTGMMGGSTQTLSKQDGGLRYSSANPDLVLSYIASNKLNFFAEIYGQSQTGPKQGWGFNLDYGALYLLNPAIVLDIEIGQRLYGYLGNFEHYIGAGISLMLG